MCDADLDLGHLFPTEAGHLDRRCVQQQLAVRVVDVRSSLGCERRVEQGRLRAEVRLHRLVEVEVVATEVREHDDVELGAVDTVVHHRVRGHLHHDRVDTVGDELGESALQIGRLRGGPGTRECAERALRQSVRSQDGGEHVRRRRLPVRARDPDEAKRA